MHDNKQKNREQLKKKLIIIIMDNKTYFNKIQTLSPAKKYKNKKEPLPLGLKAEKRRRRNKLHETK